jgi:hypothetical protein
MADMAVVSIAAEEGTRERRAVDMSPEGTIVGDSDMRLAANARQNLTRISCPSVAA